MSDISMGFAPASATRPTHPRPRRRHGSLEYQAYHALVFAAALPFAAAAFAADAARGRPGPSPVRRARRHAWAITPMIFAP